VPARVPPDIFSTTDSDAALKLAVPLVIAVVVGL
jgi:hypothetical protein